MGGTLKIKWILNFLDYQCVTGTYLSVLHAEIESLFILGSFMYERQEDRFDPIRDKLFKFFGHDYESNGLASLTSEKELFQRINEDFEDMNLTHILRSRMVGRIH